jgi:flagellin-like hook-associated protein FlgL
MKLYELTAELSTAIDRYNEAETQEQLDAIAQHINSLAIPFKQKAVATAKHIISIESDAESIQSEIDRLRGHLDRISKQGEWFRDYLSNSMLMTNTEKIEDAGIKLSFRRSTRTEILDESLVPESYKKEKIVKTVDKEAIKESWKNGVGVDGTRVIEVKNLSIK